jgi:hypothetical protein
VSIVSSQLMSRLAPALLGSVLHLELVALLLVEVTKVRDRRRVLGSGVRRWAHSSSWRVTGVVGAEWWLCCRLYVVCRSKSTELEGRSG